MKEHGVNDKKNLILIEKTGQAFFEEVTVKLKSEV